MLPITNNKFSIPLYLAVKKSDAPHIDPYYGQNQTVQMGETVSLDCKIYSVLNR